MATYLKEPLQLGDLTLKNRVFMAPCTRARSTNRLANDLNTEYYQQRSGAGLIITEATAISKQGYGWRDSPALYEKEHANAWKKVSDAVHAKDGRIFLQLWHMGRQSHSSYQENNAQIVAPSAIAVPSEVHAADGSKVPYETPRALDLAEIPAIVQDYKKSAELAKEAGFDGVEIHAANGYLVDQFLQSVSNTREDKYGGSKENRFRLLDEIVVAVSEVWPKERIGVRLSPNGVFGGMGSDDNHEVFRWYAEQLKDRVVYISLMDGLGFGFHNKCKAVSCFDIKLAFGGAVFGNVAYDAKTAEGAVRSGAVDAILFGRPYLSNPDLAERILNGWPLNPDADMSTWYAGGYDSETSKKGYTDFPFYTPPQNEKQEN